MSARRSGAIVPVATAIGAAGTAIIVGMTPPALSIDEALALIPHLHGKSRYVTVTGYLGNCGGYDCLLHSDRTGPERLRQSSAELLKWSRSGRVGAVPRDPAFLSLAGGTELERRFDRKAQPYNHGYVVVTGRLTDICRDERNQYGCLDRGPDLVPTSIKPLSRSGTPTNIH